MGNPGKRLTVAAGSRPTTSGRGPAKPTGFREGPVGLGATHHWPFFITYRAGKPVMYEYEGPHNTKNFSYNLRWPQRGRNYYREGDMILHRETPGGKYLKWTFPTLASRSGKETLLERFGLESERGRTGTSAKAQMDMASELQGWFTGKMKGLLKDLIGAMVGG
jgi:hypothetical protein